MTYDEAGTDMDIDQTERTVNEPLLRKVLDHITAHPEEWNQAMWGLRSACGTAFCFAGHAIVMSGEHGLSWRRHQLGARLDRVGGRDPMQVGAEVLGLSRRQALYLFSPINTLRELYTFADEYTDGAIAVPDELPDGS